MKFWLRYESHDLELHQGRFCIGRGEDCQLALDDPLVSRRHAAFTIVSDRVWVEDLDSCNGVSVNGKPLESAREVMHGDTVQVGSQRLTVVCARHPQDTTINQDAISVRARGDMFGVLATLADKSFALGQGEEAERILATHLNQLLADVQAGREISPEVLESGSRYASKLAVLTQKAHWFNYVFEIYLASDTRCPMDVVDALYSVIPRMAGVDPSSVAKYTDRLRSDLDSMGPTDRFLLGRVEGLERLIRLR